MLTVVALQLFSAFVSKITVKITEFSTKDAWNFEEQVLIIRQKEVD